MTFRATNPYTGERGPGYAEHSSAEVAQKLALAAEAQAAWASLGPDARADYLARLARVLLERKPLLAELASWEMGKHLREAKAEVEKCAACCRYYAEHGPGLLAEVPTAMAGGGVAAVGFRPLGLVLAIMPWNFPFWQVVRAAVPALLAGNALVLKHAEVVPGCAQALEDAFEAAGFAPGLFTNLRLPHDRVEEVLAHPAVAALTLTGSERAGQAAGMLAAKYLKKQVLELGGSDAFVVLQDADLELAAAKAAESRMINTGQSCIAAKRFIVVKPLYEVFTALLCEQLGGLVMGDPMQADVHFGPLVHPKAAGHLANQVERAVAAGARVRLAGGHAGGAMFRPVVLADVGPGNPAFDEELFGPVAAVACAQDEADALRLANASAYGLGSSVWTRDRERGLAFARQMQCGGVYLNGVMKSDPALPFGGVKRSGHGRELAVFGLHEFVNVQAVVG